MSAERPFSPLLVASLALSAVSLLLPDIGPLGPLVAGVLAFLGYRKVVRSKGTVRGPGLAKVAMTKGLRPMRSAIFPAGM